MSEVLAALPPDGAPPVLAAGGMAMGTQAAAYLTLGAAGVVLGTRFLLTPESPYKPAQKAALLAARSPLATVRTLALDYAGDTAYWPAHIDGRGLRNGIVEDVEAGVSHVAVQAKCREATERGDASYMVVWAGQGVALMNEIKPIKVCHSSTQYLVLALRAAAFAVSRVLLLHSFHHARRLRWYDNSLTCLCRTGRDGRAAHGSREAVAEVTEAAARALKSQPTDEFKCPPPPSLPHAIVGRTELGP